MLLYIKEREEEGKTEEKSEKGRERIKEQDIWKGKRALRGRKQAYTTK